MNYEIEKAIFYEGIFKCFAQCGVKKIVKKKDEEEKVNAADFDPNFMAIFIEIYNDFWVFLCVEKF